MIGAKSALSVAGLLALAACAVPVPSAPDVMALPGQGKTLATFQREDVNCRGYAQQALAPYVQPAPNGAAPGAANGTSIGAGPVSAAAASGDLQQAYDIAYTQCMYSNGNKVTSPPAGAVYADAYPYPYGYYPGYFEGPIGFGFGFGGGYGGYRGYDRGFGGGYGGGYRGGFHR